MKISLTAIVAVVFSIAAVGIVGTGVAHAQQGWNNPVRCNSQNGRYARCVMPWRDARLLRQESKARCIRDESWGVERGVLWVDRGCRGLFVGADDRYGYDDRDRDDRYGNGYGHDRDGWRPGPGWDREIRLQCDSNGRHYQMCQVDTGRRGRARLVRQLSSARCTEGYSWGFNRAGVWVDHGCRGQFVVERRW